jgi:methylmalonyl-CoA mutase N-terminal domain/subunit
MSAHEAELERLRTEVAAWRAAYGVLPSAVAWSLPRSPGIGGTRLHSARSRDGLGAPDELPGVWPFTRGIHPTMYRGRLWTMRQFSGFGTAEDTNRATSSCSTGDRLDCRSPSIFPTLMGYDSDHPRSEGEVGKCGVAISSLRTWRTCLPGSRWTWSRPP